MEGLWELVAGGKMEGFWGGLLAGDEEILEEMVDMGYAVVHRWGMCTTSW